MTFSESNTVVMWFLFCQVIDHLYCLLKHSMYLLKETMRLNSKMIKIQYLLLRWKRQRSLEITEFETINHQSDARWSLQSNHGDGLLEWSKRNISLFGQTVAQRWNDPTKVGLAVLKAAAGSEPKWTKGMWTGNLFGGHGTSGVQVFYHLWVTVTVGLRVGSWGSQGGGQRARVGGDVVFIVVVRLGRPLRVTAGEEVGACPGHSSFLFRARAAHLLPGNHRNIRSAAMSRVCICVWRSCCVQDWNYCSQWSL